MTLCWGSKRKGKNAYGKNQPDADYRSKSTVYLKEKIWYYVSSRSEFVEESNLLVLNKLERLLTVCFKPKENYTRSELLKVNEK